MAKNKTENEVASLKKWLREKEREADRNDAASVRNSFAAWAEMEDEERRKGDATPGQDVDPSTGTKKTVRGSERLKN